MGLIIEDFATWCEKLHRKSLREGMECRVPEFIPVTLNEALRFIEEIKEGSDIPLEIKEKAENWRIKLCQSKIFRLGRNSRQ